MKIKEIFFSKFLYLFQLLWLFPIYGQNNTRLTDGIAENFQTLTRNQTFDNIYLQTSKDIYETKEDLWFKGYILDSQSFTPSNRNKPLCTESAEVCFTRD